MYKIISQSNTPETLLIEQYQQEINENQIDPPTPGEDFSSQADLIEQYQQEINENQIDPPTPGETFNSPIHTKLISKKNCLSGAHIKGIPLNLETYKEGLYNPPMIIVGIRLKKLTGEYIPEQEDKKAPKFWGEDKITIPKCAELAKNLNFSPEETAKSKKFADKLIIDIYDDFEDEKFKITNYSEIIEYFFFALENYIHKYDLKITTFKELTKLIEEPSDFKKVLMDEFKI